MGLTLNEKPLYLNASNTGVILELKDIKALIDLMKKNDLSVFEMEKDGFKIKLQKGTGDPSGYAIARGPLSAVAAPVAAAPAPAPVAAPRKRGARSVMLFLQWSALFTGPALPNPRRLPM